MVVSQLVLPSAHERSRQGPASLRRATNEAAVGRDGRGTRNRGSAAAFPKGARAVKNQPAEQARRILGGGSDSIGAAAESRKNVVRTRGAGRRHTFPHYPPRLARSD